MVLKHPKTRLMKIFYWNGIRAWEIEQFPFFNRGYESELDFIQKENAACQKQGLTVRAYWIS